MKTLLLFVLLSMTCFGALSNSALDIKLKESLHLLSIQGKKATAAEQTLKLIQTKDLTKKQAQQIYPVLLRTMQAANQQELISQAITACKSHQIKFDKLEELFLFAAPESANPNTAAIQESLEYMWNNFDWRTDEADLKYFNQYLEKMGAREDLPLIARVQAGIVNFSIFATHYWDNKDSMQEEQFQTLLSDLNNTDNSYSASTIYASIKRLELNARKYAAAGNYEMAVYLTKLLKYFSLVVGETQNGTLTQIFCDKINSKINQHFYFPINVNMYETIFSNSTNRISFQIVLSSTKFSKIRLKRELIQGTNRQSTKRMEIYWPFTVKRERQSEWWDFSITNNLLNSDLNSARITYNIIAKRRFTRYESCATIESLIKHTKFCFPTNSFPLKRYGSEYSDRYNQYKSEVLLRYPQTKINEICQTISSNLLAIGPTINDLKEYAETQAASKPKKRLNPDKKLSELEVRDLLLEFFDVGTSDTKKGLEILETLQPYMTSNRYFNTVLLNYPNNRFISERNIGDLITNYITDNEALDSNWYYWRILPSCLDMYEAMQIKSGSTNKFDYKEIAKTSGVAECYEIEGFYRAVGCEFWDEYNLYASKITYEYIKYYTENIKEPSEFTAAYLMELLTPFLVEKSEKINASYRLPGLRRANPTIMMLLNLAFESIKVHPNNASKPKFTEKTLKKLVKDLREYGQKNREKE